MIANMLPSFARSAARRLSWLVPSLALAVSIGCASRPRLKGTETLAQLRAAVDGTDAKTGADDACWLEQDATACAWVSAYWKADYADADRNCRSGDAKRCEDAARYAGGCAKDEHVRGIPSGDSLDDADDQGDMTACSDTMPYPPALIQAPPISGAKAIEHLATGCRRGQSDMCIDAYSGILEGQVMGLELPLDVELAKALYARYRVLAGEDPNKIDWNGFDSHNRLKETADERRQRLARIAAVYAAGDAKNAALIAKLTQDRAESEGSTLQAVALG
jgi:hypothetical protein